MLHGVRLRQDRDLSGHQPILPTLPVMVALDVKLHHRANRQLDALILWEYAVRVDEKIAGEPVGI
eukprot:CAMPEP_0176131192 /NCGR_PEP_ID=MMETSP0120_2-20121206/66408_1 /TAXON_ID=160619 /ORGANISM="Kryptoperidinium foliaceum, Strain CCMP 1326" /LENGTH=64 /DNA_ID=CAMNT_0017466549 /DNA_START=32 /DNA_END=223 /DNA_ORIENTATION=+